VKIENKSKDAGKMNLGAKKRDKVLEPLKINP
jgi:hypothetical protein